MKTLNTLCCLLILFICYIPYKASSNQIAGGDIYYRQIDNNTYAVYVRIYWNCKGDGFQVPPPATLPLCISNTCTSTTSMSTLKLAPGAYEVPTPCANMPTTCTSITSTLPGYMFCTYSDTLTTPFRCNYWKFSTYFDHRDYALNGPPPSVYFYMDATLNDSGSYYVNSSPVTTTYGNLNIPYGQPLYYNCSPYDINGDSIASEIVSPLAPSSLNCSGSTYTIPFTTKTPPLNLTNNPFQTNNTFTFDPKTGDMTFVPMELGAQLLAVRLRKYRNSKLIGTCLKEVFFNVMVNKSATNPIFSVNSFANCTYSANKIFVCPNQPFSFAANIKSASPGGIYLLNDNHTLFASAATVTYTSQGTDSVHVVFSWTAPSKSYTEHNLTFIIKDSTCTAPGITYYRTVTIPIVVLGKPTALSDTAICLGTSASLRAIGGGNYTWSHISGTPGSLSCTACSTTTVTPTVTSRYLLTSAAGASCGNNKDTVTVTVNPATTPSVTITANPGYYVVDGTHVVFSATPTNCSNPIYTWKLNGNVITGVTGSSFSTSTLKTSDVVTCQLSCSDPCPSPSNPSSNQITMQVVPVGINQMNAVTTVSIYPNPNSGIFTIEITPDRIERCKIEVINILGEIMYKENEAVLTGKKQLDLSHLPSGVYTIKFNETIQHIVISK